MSGFALRTLATMRHGRSPDSVHVNVAGHVVSDSSDMALYADANA